MRRTETERERVGVGWGLEIDHPKNAYSPGETLHCMCKIQIPPLGPQAKVVQRHVFYITQYYITAITGVPSRK